MTGLPASIAPGCADELLQALGELLRTADATPDRLALRIGASLTDTLRREAVLGPDARQREEDRLRVLLGASGAREALRSQLCRRIAAGDASLDAQALVEHLWATALDQLAIDQPRYAWGA